MFTVPEKYRLTTGILSSDSTYGCNGAFILTYETHKVLAEIACIASDGEGWEHVSVVIQSKQRRNPSWDEMIFVKNIFWGSNDTVIQFHPPESNYVNFHKYCLHLWRPIGIKIPLPPTKMIGPTKSEKVAMRF